ncbi:MAG TPA: A/G-specific adenine glycosylase [Thermodesulfobacteriota bacterium]|nr:A/G-specific adenine glycosylase [Thermodesulfobacteriota bacterium]
MPARPSQTTRRPARPAADAVPLAPGLVRRFRSRLLRWFAVHGRDLPWRRTTDPYRILVSEIMLQQTQVERVKPKYEAWVAKWPTFEALAAAPLEAVCAEWRPLGYNIRPVRLHSIAREAVARYGGRLPDDAEALLAMKGIGRYTAGALLAFAFGRDAPVLDTNVLRVLHRVFLGPGLPPGAPLDRQPRADHATRRRLWELAARLVPRGKAWAFNSALMDLGALVCTARKPRCLLCPMRDLCASSPLARPAGRPPGARRREPPARRSA